MKILFVSLGCDKNLVDSEEMLGDLTQAGYEITDDETAAEAAVVNTCCFINDAKKESIETILELAQRRTDGQLRALIVTGCLAQRYSRDILQEIPEVDAVIGTTAQETLLQTLEEVIGRERSSDASLPLRKAERKKTVHWSASMICAKCPAQTQNVFSQLPTDTGISGLRKAAANTVPTA